LSALRIGTRGSALALWQARRVAELIGVQPDSPPVELVHIRTEGDLRTDVPLSTIEGRAFFTKEIDRALLAKEIDIAVHSLKDLATTLEPGLELTAVLERADPRDALVAAGGCVSIAGLRKGARVGTSSLRRRAFLAHARPDIVPLELRGNVPTRIEKLCQGEYDAIVLATAGLNRLGLEGHISTHLPLADFPPAVSQGAIGVCTRADDAGVQRWLRQLDDAPTRVATTAERALLRRIEGGCQVPLGALATITGERLNLYAAVCALDGTTVITAEGSATLGKSVVGSPWREATALGMQVAEQLLERGAGRIIDLQRGVARHVADLP
jgi:hydroxymethylbilane synthase